MKAAGTDRFFVCSLLDFVLCVPGFSFLARLLSGGRFFVFVKPLTLPPPGVEEEAERERRRDVERERELA